MTERLKMAAVGGGVIGGGWIARFLLSGHDVAVFDPHPDARRIIGDVIAGAERAWHRLFDQPLPPRGTLTFHDRLEAAVAGADWVQESVPETLEIKHAVLSAIAGAAPAHALIGSSTSGFKPSDLHAGIAKPARVFVAHPFNPVYLLPLVELVAGPANDDGILEDAERVLARVGMKGLKVRAEIDAHIADRLLEAVWREGLWLVNDGIATTAEIDDAIRYGFGLRWAQMGLFETYRIAGGEAGMAHFIEQFGPALKWPWTKLMDVPELTPELAAEIGRQSDEQSGLHNLRTLERIRDDNLVGFLRVLRENDWGAGQSVAEMSETLRGVVDDAPRADATPLRLHEVTVPQSWLDYNGHMTEHRYLQVMGDATDAFLAHVGMDAGYRAAGRSVYTVETHIRHLDEVAGDARLAVETLVLGADAKRLRLFHRILDGERVVATGEHMLMHVDTAAGRASPFDAPLSDRIAALAARHSAEPLPEGAGGAIRAIARAPAAAEARG
ncbi:carnitine 3-dehydrogenase [Jannaschia rubra]|uniref:carnitine 3-dehydrogenase n=1 Tax=Jannaschia rubra TaxID=282197 RepID=UPI00248FD1C3|nr:carnitine 3-dehydrogenase [Jannaschia rubra]